MRGEKQHTEGARGEAPGEPRDTEGSAPLCSASYADPPGVAAVVSVFPVVSRPDEHIGAALSRPCSAARRRRQATTITHTSHITHLVAAHYCCCRRHPCHSLSPSPRQRCLPRPPSRIPLCCHARVICCHCCAVSRVSETAQIIYSTHHTHHTSHKDTAREERAEDTHNMRETYCGEWDIS